MLITRHCDTMTSNLTSKYLFTLLQFLVDVLQTQSTFKRYLHAWLYV